MPLYEFTCKKCGHNFEELISLSELESNQINCPACKSKRLERGFSGFATGSGSSSMSGGGFSGGGCGSGGFT
ncbi:MAG: zinc ribbon domain-containing protein [Gemmatimonadales bacterium]|nr:zinc ribbon domain-containing protein [Gemmatimonadales bacterium]